jgi:hypothetical protein
MAQSLLKCLDIEYFSFDPVVEVVKWIFESLSLEKFQMTMGIAYHISERLIKVTCVISQDQLRLGLIRVEMKGFLFVLMKNLDQLFCKVN